MASPAVIRPGATLLKRSIHRQQPNIPGDRAAVQRKTSLRGRKWQGVVAVTRRRAPDGPKRPPGVFDETVANALLGWTAARQAAPADAFRERCGTPRSEQRLVRQEIGIAQYQ